MLCSVGVVWTCDLLNESGDGVLLAAKCGWSDTSVHLAATKCCLGDVSVDLAATKCGLVLSSGSS